MYYNKLTQQGKKLVDDYKNLRYELGKLTEQATISGKTVNQFARDIGLAPHKLNDIYFEYRMSAKLENVVDINVAMTTIGRMKRYGQINLNTSKKDLNNIYNMVENYSNEKRKLNRYTKDLNAMIHLVGSASIEDLTVSEIDEIQSKVQTLEGLLDMLKWSIGNEDFKKIQ